MTNTSIFQTIAISIFAAACMASSRGGQPPSDDVATDDIGDNDVGDNDTGDDGAAPGCAANHVLRCSGDLLVRCDADGATEVNAPCELGCNATELRCTEMVPSNGLATHLSQANAETVLNFGANAFIDTDSGDVTVDGKPVDVVSYVAPQSGAPDIRVFVVGRLTTQNVTVVGQNALAIASAGDITIGGTFNVSATANTPGAGAFHDDNCVGKRGQVVAPSTLRGSAGGGGFGSPGGAGGISNNEISGQGTQNGGAGGATSGNASLVPLRGGCAGGAGRHSTSTRGGGGGGAVALVSRTQIVVGMNGKIAANGGAWLGGGGSGGGILLEAPVVDVSGAVVANGGGGTGFGDNAEDGHMDATPAKGGPERLTGKQAPPNWATDGRGGNGGAGKLEAQNGAPGMNHPDGSPEGSGGNGGGGVGRIRINTRNPVRRSSGVFSPEPMWSDLAVR